MDLAYDLGFKIDKSRSLCSNTVQKAERNPYLMKKIAVFLASLVIASSVHGQGFFIFGNTQSTGNITIHGGVPGEGAEGNFVGTGYNATLFWGPNNAIMFSQLSSLLPPNSTVSNGTPSSEETAAFLGVAPSEPDQHNEAGFFFDGTVQFGNTLNIPIKVAVAVWWNGPGAFGVATSYSQALLDGYNTGVSDLVPLTLQIGANPNVPNLSALQPFIVGVPEPSTSAICGLGAASLCLFRRKNK